MKWFWRTFIKLCIIRTQLLLWAFCDEQTPKSQGPSSNAPPNAPPYAPTSAPPYAPPSAPLNAQANSVPNAASSAAPITTLNAPPNAPSGAPSNDQSTKPDCPKRQKCARNLCDKPLCFRPPSWINKDEEAIKRCVCRPPARPCHRIDAESWSWINPGKKYKNPLRTPTGGFPTWLALALGIAGGFGLVTMLNWTKPKKRKYICYHPPPPYLEYEPPPNCCRPTIIEIDESGCPINEKKENEPKTCYKVKILDPCDIHDHDPCAPVECDKKEEK